MKSILRALGLAFIVWLMTLCFILFVSFAWPQEAPLPEPADAIVCLGADMSLMGWVKPGPASARRARTCAELQLAGVAPLVLFTGGGHERMSAARAMANLALSEGVNPNAILVEEESGSTIQNAAFGLALLPKDMARIVVVSDAFHLPRAWLIFKAFRAPETALYAARMEYATAHHPNDRTYLGWVARESVAIWFNVGRALAFAAGGIIGLDEEARVSWFN